MKWSFKLVKIAGIDVKVHLTFFLILIWFGYSYWAASKSITAVAQGLLFILLLFMFVVLHEFGHALVARKFGIKTRDITLLPIGGVAQLERMPRDPKQELWVALAGPAVNLLLAIILFGWLFLTNNLQNLTQLNLTSGSLIERLAIVNLTLMLFNLIPAFPMDGGRVLRALLALRMDYIKATQTAVIFGQAFALIFGIIGLFSDPIFLFIALFIWIGAGQENNGVQVKETFAGIPARRAMLTNFQTLSPSQRLHDAVSAILAGYQQDFPIMDGNKMVGVLTRPALMKTLAQEGETVNIASVMDRDFTSAEADEMLDTVADRLRNCGCSTVPVFDDGVLVGLITMENIGEFLMIQSALRRSHLGIQA